MNKQSTVLAIGALTGGAPETLILGPGSKEKMAVISDLAKALKLSVEPGLSKPAMAAAICTTYGVGWGTDCESTGDTITGEGLRRLLLVAVNNL